MRNSQEKDRGKSSIFACFFITGISGSKHISLSELTDSELVPDEAFRLVVTAFCFSVIV